MFLQLQTVTFKQEVTLTCCQFENREQVHMFQERDCHFHFYSVGMAHLWSGYLTYLLQQPIESGGKSQDECCS